MRRKRLLRVSVVVMLLLVLSLAIVFQHGRESTRERLRTESRLNANMAQQETQRGAPEKAMALTLAALPTDGSRPDRPYVAEAQAQLYLAVASFLPSRDFGMGQEVVRASFSQRGNRMLAVSVSRACTWDLSSHDKPFCVPLEQNGSKAVLSPDGEVLAVAEGTRIHLWNTAKHQRVTTFSDGHGLSISDIGFSPDGTFLVSSSLDGHLLAWDLSKGELSGPLVEPQKRLSRLTISADSRLVATADEDGRILICSLDGSKPPRYLEEHFGIHNLAFSPADHSLLVKDDTGSYLWQEDLTQQVWVPGIDAAFRPDGSLVVLGKDGEISLRSPQNTTRAKLRGLTATSMVLSPNGRFLMTFSRDDDRQLQRRLWHLDSETLLNDFAGHRFFDVVFHPSGKKIALSQPSNLRLLDIGKLIRGTYVGPQSGIGISGLTFNKTNRYLAGITHESIFCYDLKTQKHIALEKPIAAGHIALSPEDPGYLAASFEGAVHVWQAPSGRFLGQLLLQRQKTHGRGLKQSRPTPENEAEVVHLGFSEGGRHLGTATDEGVVQVWTTSPLQPQGRAYLHDSPVVQFGIDDHRMQLTTVTVDGFVRVWRLGSRDPSFQWHLDAPVPRLALFSPDLSRLVTITDHQFWLWDLASRTLIAHREHSGIARWFFSPDGRKLANGVADAIYLYDAHSGKPDALLTGHLGPIVQATIHSDGTRMLTASMDGTVRAWDLAKGQTTAILPNHDQWIANLGFLPTAYVTVSKGGFLRQWPNFSLEELRARAEASLKDMEK